MQHLDEGTIHALLDGELAGAEGTEALAHIESCEECLARLAEERLMQGEADRMILELDAPAPRPAAPLPPEQPYVLMPPPPEGQVRQGPPIVLVPERDTDRPRMPIRYLAAAAMLIVAAGAGYLATATRRAPPPSGPQGFSDAPVTISLPPIAGDAARGDTTETAPTGDPTSRGLAAEDSVVPETARRADLNRSAALRDSAPTVALTESRAARAAERTPVTRPPEQRTPPREQDGAAARRQERGVERPLDPDSRAREAAAVAEAEGGPPPATTAAPRPAAPVSSPPRRASGLDQEAQITMRVGLDEAQRMLGGPVHVIDGLRPEFMGLVEGRLVPGADPNAYVVRVVYLDDNRRPLYLDQQRLDQSRRLTGAGRDTTPPDWVKGDVRLSLKGSVGGAELRALAGRVR